MIKSKGYRPRGGQTTYGPEDIVQWLALNYSGDQERFDHVKRDVPEFRDILTRERYQRVNELLRKQYALPWVRKTRNRVDHALYVGIHGSDPAGRNFAADHVEHVIPVGQWSTAIINSREAADGLDGLLFRLAWLGPVATVSIAHGKQAIQKSGFESENREPLRPFARYTAAGFSRIERYDGVSAVNLSLIDHYRAIVAQTSFTAAILDAALDDDMAQIRRALEHLSADTAEAARDGDAEG